MNKLAILGGTFDPFHSGHLEIARAAVASGEAGTVMIVPAKVSPFKQGKEMASEEDRYNMAKLAAEEVPGVSVSKIEMEMEGVSYTFRTLEALNERSPEEELCLIVGTDQFLALEEWYKGTDILSHYPVMVAVRPSEDEAELDRKIAAYGETYGTSVTKLGNKRIDVSSTMIKEKLARGESITGLVPAGVEAYIYEHGLYR